MKHLFPFALALISLVHCSPENTCTEAVSVVGTPISLCPPADFELKMELGGFHHRSLPASILVVEIPQPFNEAVLELTEEKLATQSITLLSKENVQVRGEEGVLCHVNKKSNGTDFGQWLLLLPNGNTSVTINGTFLKKDDERFSQLIKQAVLTSRINEGATSDEDVLPFALDVAGTPLKLAKILQGPSVMYSESGNWADHASGELSFFAGFSTSDPFLVHDKETLKEQIKQLCNTCSYAEDSIAAVTIDKLKGFEVAAFSEADSVHSKMLKYVTVLFNEGRYYLLVGSASRQYDENLDLFRKVGRSFRRKSNTPHPL
jgi:hypothetical protein